MKTELVANRDCGPCNACCQQPCISEHEFKKLPGELCRQWQPKAGCTIYETRPTVCRGYFCGWRLMPQLDESWRPDLSNIYINVMPKVPEDQRGLLPEGPVCFVFYVCGELSAVHKAQLIPIVHEMVENGVPGVLTASAPAGFMRKGLPLNPLLKSYTAKGLGDFSNAFSQVLAACGSMPMAAVCVA